tara:strand:+ start:415 stop:747 length:333 start_codon:yes stop_codon:yes gene_type:complete
VAEAKYFDLLITDNDLTLDVGGLPERCQDRDSIAQDIQHMIRESGLLVELVANRDEGKKAENLVKLTLEVDNDERIVPGSCVITEVELGRFFLQADTVEFGKINMTMETT